MKILVPIDLLHPVQPTIDELVRLTPLADAEVLFLYVKEELPSYERLMESSGDFGDDWHHQVEEKAKAAFQEAMAYIKPHCSKLSTEIVVGPPAMMIETVARDERFDMTVVTPGRHNKVEMFLLGSVTNKVLKHGPGTIVICRPRKDGLRNVLMGIDGSDQSRNALSKACEGFKLKDARITLAHFVSVADVMKMVSPVEYITAVESNLLLEGETFLADGRQILSEHGLNDVDCVLKEGDPATEMINLANALPADLVVIGAQGRTAVQHFLLGSVSQKIAMRAACSTAVIKTSKPQKR
jgi:nucleotide-binding universal stress UspA family protein